MSKEKVSAVYISIELKSKRAIRRHHYQRLKRKRIRNNYWLHNKTNRQLGICINTPKPCSCFMCGNPRKYFKENKRQEIIFENKLRCEQTFDLTP